MGLRPLGGRVVVKLDEDKKRTRGGLILPDNLKDKEPCLTGKVLRVGPGFRLLDDPVTRTPVEVKEGDHVLFGQYSGTDVEVDGEKLRIMSEGEIFAVVA